MTESQLLRRKQPIVLKDEPEQDPLPQREEASPRTTRDARQRLDSLKSELEREPIGNDTPKADRASMEGLRAQYHWVLVNKGGENNVTDTELWRPSFKFDWSSPFIRIALVVIALLAGGLAAYLVLQRNVAPAGPTPVVETADTTAAPVAAPEIVLTKVLVATAEIGVGQKLTPATMAWQEWPDTALRPEYITDAATPEALTDMDGAMARFEIFPGEPIRKTKLVSPDSGYLSAVLETGMRGVSVSVTPDAASGGFIVPNDRVDVVLIRTLPTGLIAAETILRNIKVLAIDTRLGETGTTGTPVDADPKSEIFSAPALAILELDSPGAEVVLNAINMGRLSLVLRSMADYSTADAGATSTLNQTIRMTSPFWAQ